jgi:hypothetical protein
MITRDKKGINDKKEIIDAENKLILPLIVSFLGILIYYISYITVSVVSGISEILAFMIIIFSGYMINKIFSELRTAYYKFSYVITALKISLVFLIIAIILILIFFTSTSLFSQNMYTNTSYSYAQTGYVEIGLSGIILIVGIGFLFLSAFETLISLLIGLYYLGKIRNISMIKFGGILYIIPIIQIIAPLIVLWGIKKDKLSIK